jgi:hypothetical protein
LFHSLIEYSAAALAAVGLTRALSLGEGRWRLLVAIAFAALFVELLENLALLLLLDAFPRRLSAVAWASAGITIGKFALKLSLWGTLWVLFGVWLVRGFRSGGPNERAT